MHLIKSVIVIFASLIFDLVYTRTHTTNDDEEKIFVFLFEPIKYRV